MRAIIGMENGPIKIIDMEYSKVQHMLRVGPEDLDKNGTMTTEAIAWVVPDKSFVAAINGCIFFCNVEAADPVLTKVSTYSTGSNETCVYIGLYPGSQTDVITCTTLGDVVLHQGVCAEGMAIKIEPTSAKTICKANAPAQAVCVGVRKVPLKKEKEEEEEEEEEEEKETDKKKKGEENKKPAGKKDVEFMEEPIIAIGGKKRNVVVYSLVSGAQVWAVKKQKNDPRTHLPEPVWPTCVAFSKRKPNVLVVGTGYNRIRTYDMEGKQRTAITDTLVTQRPLNCVTILEREKNPYCNEFFAFGSTYGELIYFNPFGKKKVLGGFKGITGSIRSIGYNKEVLVVAGIDRFLRIFNFKARIPIKKMYVKQIPTCMLTTQEKWNTRSMDAQDTEEIWNSLSDASEKGMAVKDEDEKVGKVEDDEDIEEYDDEEDDEEDEHDDDVTDSESDEEEEEEEEEIDDLTEGSSDDEDEDDDEDDEEDEDEDDEDEDEEDEDEDDFDDDIDDDDDDEEEEEEIIKVPNKKKPKKMN